MMQMSPPPDRPTGAGHSSAAAGSVPTSAAGRLEAYGAVALLRPTTQPLEAPQFLRALLEGIATSCMEAGATLIGHLKCALHTDEGPIHCNLTSARLGATCRVSDGVGGEAVATIRPGQEARLDLVVLVYGLSAVVIDEIVDAVLDELLDPLSVRRGKRASGPDHHA